MLKGRKQNGLDATAKVLHLNYFYWIIDNQKYEDIVPEKKDIKGILGKITTPSRFMKMKKNGYNFHKKGPLGKNHHFTKGAILLRYFANKRNH